MSQSSVFSFLKPFKWCITNTRSRIGILMDKKAKNCSWWLLSAELQLNFCHKYRLDFIELGPNQQFSRGRSLSKWRIINIPSSIGIPMDRKSQNLLLVFICVLLWVFIFIEQVSTCSSLFTWIVTVLTSIEILMDRKCRNLLLVFIFRDDQTCCRHKYRLDYVHQGPNHQFLNCRSPFYWTFTHLASWIEILICRKMPKFAINALFPRCSN